MCGIAGIYLQHGQITDAERDQVDRLTTLQQHRGPDDAGMVEFGHLVLGHRRLSIIDLSPTGHQPMADPDGRYWITFNGEIYNYQRLRTELIARGRSFRGNADTEVILHGYAEWGEQFIQRLEGMFAIALWDGPMDRLLLIRDRMGVKPLYYHAESGRIAFASEVQALVTGADLPTDLDRDALWHYSVLGYVPEPATIYRHVRAVAPGEIVTITRHSLTQTAYWTIPRPDRPRHQPYPDAVRELRTLLEESVAAHQVSDVPVAGFLSGGIDSTAIVALMARTATQPIQTFTLTSQHARMDEGSLARLVAARIGTIHREHLVRAADLRDTLLPSIQRMSQPFSDYFETYFVSSLAARHVKVVLSGAGGDELFAGYHQLRAKLALVHPVARVLAPLTAPISGVLERHPMGATAQRLLGLARNTDYATREVAGYSYSGAEQRALFESGWIGSGDNQTTENYLVALYGAGAVTGDAIRSFMYFDLKNYLQDYLLPLTDSAAMAHSLEVRVPLLDHRIVEFAARTPSSYKFGHGVTKRILRDAVRDLLPVEALRGPKRGFGVPRHDFIRHDLRPLVEAVLSPQSVASRNIFRPEAVERVVNRFYAVSPTRMLWSDFQRVWNLFILELWLRVHVDGCGEDWSGAELPDLVRPAERDLALLRN